MIEAPLDNPLVRIDSEVTRRVRQHARAHMQTEVCGVLIGKLCDGVLAIEAPIEAFNATQAGAHVTFTQAAWETIYRVKDKNYPAERIVGWYHSHPGFGVFLSEHDTFIHRNFFSSPDQVAWVYDPHSDEEGCFGWVDGSIHRLPTIHVADNNAEGAARTGGRLANGSTKPAAHPPHPPVPASPPAFSPMPRARHAWPSQIVLHLRKTGMGWFHARRSLCNTSSSSLRRWFHVPNFFSPAAGPGLADAPEPAFDSTRGHAHDQLPPENRQ